MALRSIRRHLAELERMGLITRRERPGMPGLLIIEDPSNRETEDYLRNYAGRGEGKIVLGSLPAGRWLIAAMIPPSAGYSFLWRWMSSGSSAKSSGNGSAIGW